MIVRVMLIGAVLAVIYLITKLFQQPSGFVRCGRCEGRGFWYAARGKETCDWCKGSGRLPRNLQQ